MVIAATSRGTACRAPTEVTSFDPAGTVMARPLLLAVGERRVASATGMESEAMEMGARSSRGPSLLGFSIGEQKANVQGRKILVVGQFPIIPFVRRNQMNPFHIDSDHVGLNMRSLSAPSCVKRPK